MCAAKAARLRGGVLVLSYLPAFDSKGDVMANLSVRGVAEKSLQRIKQTAKRRGVSVNRLIADMLNAETGLAPVAKALVAHHDLDKLAGTWNAAEARAFDEATASFGQIDKGLWR
jgi:hypothetical protein